MGYPTYPPHGIFYPHFWGMEKIIVTTQDELESLIQTTVRKVISEHSDNAKEPQDAILSIEQASQFLNLAKQTIYGFTSKNEIPFIKRGKKLYFRKSDLESWLLEGKRKTLKDIQQDAVTHLNNKRK